MISVKKIILVLALSLFFLTGCGVMGGGVIVETGYIAQPLPVQAPMHGRRGYYNYYYYPSAELYFDIRRNLYFYLDSDSNWSFSATLPVYLRHNLQSNYVEIEMDDARPYRRHQYYKNKYRKHELRDKRKLKAKRHSNKNYHSDGYKKHYNNGYKKSKKNHRKDNDERGQHKKRKRYDRD